MRVVVTDTCFVWKYYQHVLEKFKDMLLVVYLDGEPKTDEYEYLVCKYDSENEETNVYDLVDVKVDTFPSLKEKLSEKLKGDEEILFLTDYDLISLYPLVSTLDGGMDKKIHLCTISPFRFDIEKYVEYLKILSGSSGLTSILYIDSNKHLNISRETSLLDNLKKIENLYISVLPTVINSVERLDGKFFFDWSSGKYVDISKASDNLFSPEKISCDSSIFTLMTGLI